MTLHAQKRLNKAVDILLQICPHRWITNEVTGRKETHSISFITLTISDKVRKLTADEGYKLLLAPWIRIMRNKEGMHTYIWKAEFQKNGQLHYHITTPSWINYQRIKDCWNNILSEKGMLFINPCGPAQGFPNSVDVHKVYNLNKIRGEMVKYLSKGNCDIQKFFQKHKIAFPEVQEGKLLFDAKIVFKDSPKLLKEYELLPEWSVTIGKLWDCSLNIKKTKYYSVIEPSKMKLEHLQKDIKHSERFSYLKCDNPLQNLPDNIQKDYINYVDAARMVKDDANLKIGKNLVKFKSNIY